MAERAFETTHVATPKQSNQSIAASNQQRSESTPGGRIQPDKKHSHPVGQEISLWLEPNKLTTFRTFRRQRPEAYYDHQGDFADRILRLVDIRISWQFASGTAWFNFDQPNIMMLETMWENGVEYTYIYDSHFNGNVWVNFQDGYAEFQGQHYSIVRRAL
ncbi:hypothetical protein BC937DRAFT_90140 [Endogone sp. FLAS-F59071]|nr:hypothetical protein BC937DRAFT_90140 [Endogone sp. FLAS-F59071]|eukprot:RUS17315.1 hypothetical protein BC937DRAFT_90140 [Endogone sp. FLAS-F59071]